MSARLPPIPLLTLLLFAMGAVVISLASHGFGNAPMAPPQNTTPVDWSALVQNARLAYREVEFEGMRWSIPQSMRHETVARAGWSAFFPELDSTGPMLTFSLFYLQPAEIIDESRNGLTAHEVVKNERVVVSNNISWTTIRHSTEQGNDRVLWITAVPEGSVFVVYDAVGLEEVSLLFDEIVRSAKRK